MNRSIAPDQLRPRSFYPFSVRISILVHDLNLPPPLILREEAPVCSPLNMAPLSLLSDQTSFHLFLVISFIEHRHITGCAYLHRWLESAEDIGSSTVLYRTILAQLSSYISVLLAELITILNIVNALHNSKTGLYSLQALYIAS